MLHYVDASVGAGKTAAFIRLVGRRLDSLNDPMRPKSENDRVYIYGAPTQRLCDETATRLNEELSKFTEGPSHKFNKAGPPLKVMVIHGRSIVDNEAATSVHSASFRSVRDAVLWTSEKFNRISVVILTTATLLNIMMILKDTDRCHLFMDEAIDPLKFAKFRSKKHLSFVTDLLDVDKTDLSVHLSDRGRWVLDQLEQERQALRNGTLSTKIQKAIGDEIRTNETLLNMIKQVGTRANVSFCVVLPNKTSIEVVSFVKPDPFRVFASATFLTALFTETLLYKLWTSPRFNETLTPHPEMQAHLRDVHKQSGPRLKIGHLLHYTDNPSKEVLRRDITTGLQITKESKESDDNLVQSGLFKAMEAAQEFLKMSHRPPRTPKFLVTRNRAIERHLDPRLHKRAIPIRVDSRGMNAYSKCHAIVALAAVNPTPAQAKAVAQILHVKTEEVYHAFRIHNVYQALGRTSIRDPKSERPVICLVLGYKDAWFIHNLFVGSEWLGQIGQLPSISKLRASQRHKKSNHPQYADLARRRKALSEVNQDDPRYAELLAIRQAIKDLPKYPAVGTKKPLRI